MNNSKKFFLAAVCCLFFINSASAETVKWRIAQSWPEGFPLFSDVVTNMVKNVDVLTNGQFQIEIVTKEQHKGALKVFDWVKDGDYEMAHTSSHYWTSKDFNTAFFTAVPMGMITNEKHAWFHYGGGMELMQKVYAKYNMLSFPGGNSGNQMGGWFTREVNSLADLQKMRMRVPGLGGKVLQKLGATILKIPGGELYAAMRDGKLDSMEFVGPALDYERKYHEVANYYYTGWHSPGAELQFLINKDKFAELTPQFQAVLTLAMNQAAYNMNIQTYHQNAENLATILNDHPNVKIRAFPRRVYRAFGIAMDEILAEQAKSGDELTREIIESRDNYLSKVRQWTRISDQAFLNNVLK